MGRAFPLVSCKSNYSQKRNNICRKKAQETQKKQVILCAFCASLRLIDFEFFVPLSLRGRSGSGLSG
jgi:hypothetical protein